jgi:hypothetical protein
VKQKVRLKALATRQAEAVPLALRPVNGAFEARFSGHSASLMVLTPGERATFQTRAEHAAFNFQRVCAHDAR